MGVLASAALLFPLLSAAPQAGAQVPEAGALQEQFARAATRHGVPESVLLAVSYLQSRWDAHGGAPSVTGGYGPMHLTDAVTALAGSAPHHSEEAEDARGDSSRAVRSGAGTPVPAAASLPARLRTLERASALSGIPAEELRTGTAANIEGGAALLAAAQREAGLPASTDPGDWYGAVARYSGADDSATASTYANDVFDVIRAGESRRTDSGQVVTLPAAPSVEPATEQVAALGLRRPAGGPVECPRSVACEWIPAPYEEFGDGDYGNHDKANRPDSQSIDYIVIHDTEATWDVTLKLVQDPTYVSWQYSLRSSDGHVAQHLRLKDVGWHAGNWFVNAKSVGLEHEGFLTAPDSWYTEAMYRTSARLVRYLAARYGIPLDRQHILGHDNVPGTVTSSIKGMHTDPGPYWDWAHYFRLLGRPITPSAGPRAEVVTIRPEYGANRPVYTGCVTAGEACAPHGSGAVRLHTAPSADAPLVKDIGLRPGGQDSTTGVNDTGARASTGQSFAVAERRGDWTAVWYLGQMAWFHNPVKAPTAVNARGLVLTPREGLASVPVYGRAYPEAAAYPAGVPVQAVSPLPYRLLAGQRYVVGGRTPGEYFFAPVFDSSGHKVVRGQEEYYQIQFGHRVAFVKAADVRVSPS
ncbi:MULTISPECIES: N-acetylmuramoyl-L-alanine amidase [Streptomyces]|uniref:N-acetylmuramoyl-L-alanine amidase n=1 Tax=Streptomyces venezuelae (strain ATCC 10712 / CBS 650.69 / DSM 40230 / JCM 4526 / NBRC 13096 / PD 04745) TaxID=953739 RepID=F2R5P4_STRVP|nr:N-acetylmuramoyl-L-alanine amidase [Streptomyces venezuelae]APE19763.1 N-acetylmuramoyl-L-alanine amidase [Streptomyces venezuelae]QER97170.1 N-acetylmuramoyl-L-alanine amidase [Streptomyces venezuelae ATCC 10712]CCA53555.1 N-acetylmuramoyl-L-alanine amidase [Streptomyces venezuelae ATCC 10712]